ncbi:hypothetical protein ACT7CU_16615 [Bacillus paranthracis]
MTNNKSINELIVEAREIKSATPSFVVELVRGQGGLYETTSENRYRRKSNVPRQASEERASKESC